MYIIHVLFGFPVMVHILKTCSQTNYKHSLSGAFDVSPIKKYTQSKVEPACLIDSLKTIWVTVLHFEGDERRSSYEKFLTCTVPSFSKSSIEKFLTCTVPSFSKSSICVDFCNLADPVSGQDKFQLEKYVVKNLSDVTSQLGPLLNPKCSWTILLHSYFICIPDP